MLDGVTITVTGGAGGHGRTSMHREKFVPKGGPDGGDGGRGGRIFLRALDDVYTLEIYRSKSRFKAGDGGNGGVSLRTGAHGADLFLDVPAGTIVIDAETEDVLADLKHAGQETLVAHGGRGGWGNKRFATSTNKAPSYSQKGHPGEIVELRLELRLLADVGLIGLPNAGKSTFLAAVSNAKPKIASYPFTTLEPMLGVVNVAWDRFTLADLPGLVEGASEGYGLGFEFLKHIRRCRVLLHLVDSQSPDPVTDFELIESELRTYEPRLEQVARVIAVTKSDIDPEQARASMDTLSAHAGKTVWCISAVDGEQTEPLAAELLTLVKAEREKAEEVPPDEIPVLRPESPLRFDVRAGGPGSWAIEGRRIVQFVEMMDTEMEGAGAEVQRRLERWGVVKALRRAGAQTGDTLIFGESNIEFEG